MWLKVRGDVIAPPPSSPRKRGPIRRGGRDGHDVSRLWLGLALSPQTRSCGYGSLRSQGRREKSRHRKAQRPAAACHIDRGKAGCREAAGAAIALLVDLEFAFAGAELRGAAPVQRTILQLDGAVFAVDGFGKTEDLFGLAGHVGMQAFAGIDAVPAAADHGLA